MHGEEGLCMVKGVRGKGGVALERVGRILLECMLVFETVCYWQNFATCPISSTRQINCILLCFNIYFFFPVFPFSKIIRILYFSFCRVKNAEPT